MSPAPAPRPPRRPVGQVTRGKTAPGRLRSVDAFIALYDPGLLRRRDGAWAEAPFVDLGFGERPATTLEAAARFRRLNPALRVVGVEIDPARVAAAAPYADDRTVFRLGGFNLPLGRTAEGRPEGARLIRAFNVLRQYDAAAVEEAWALMAAQLQPGGLLLEGSCDPLGRLWVASLLRRPAGGGPGPVLEGVAFGSRLAAAFDPRAFQAVLPKRYIHRMQPGEPVWAWFEAWATAWRSALPERVWGERRLFVASAERLAAACPEAYAPRRLTRRGYLIWRAPAGS